MASGIVDSFSLKHFERPEPKLSGLSLCGVGDAFLVTWVGHVTCVHCLRMLALSTANHAHTSQKYSQENP